MSAPLGNQFWKNRSKHGRDVLFATSDLLWGAACEYFQWCDENPWLKVEQMKRPTVTKDKVGDLEVSTVHSIAHIPTARPYTITGLCLYLDCGKNYFEQFKAKHVDDDFSGVITRIEEIIYTQKFEGAAVGAFNANIIARDLGLIDKTEVAPKGGKRVRRDDESGDIIIEDV